MNSKNTTFLTKVFSFCAAHQYGNEKWTEQENWDVFGKDTRVHGHNYTLHVTVTGKVNPDSGFLVDLGHLKKIVNTHVVDVLDHSQIEKDIEWFKDKQPSSEVLVVWIWDQIVKDFKEAKLHRIRLVETFTIHTDYYGPNP